MSDFSKIHAARGAVMTVRNGKQVPLSIADKVTTYNALRKHFVVVDYSHFTVVDVTGEEVFEFLDGIVSGDLAAVRDGQALYTFVLNKQGQVLFDLCLLCDDEHYILLAESVSGTDLIAYFNSYITEQALEFVDRSNEFASLLFEGPYSWEVCKELFGMDVIGLPFMEHMRVDGGILFRFGLHGEFSYQLICDKETAQRLLEDSDDLYSKYDAVFAGLDFQDLARLENPCWDDVRLGSWSKCPITLQLQWMVRYDKEAFIGKEALEAKLVSGVQQRLVGFMADADGELAIGKGQAIYLGDTKVGVVAVSGFSPDSERMIGQLLLDVAYAYADIDGFKVGSSDIGVSISTKAVPFVRNFSFLVNPLEHSYVDSRRHKSMLEQWQAAEEAAKAAVAENTNSSQPVSLDEKNSTQVV